MIDWRDIIETSGRCRGTPIPSCDVDWLEVDVRRISLVSGPSPALDYLVEQLNRRFPKP